MRLSLRYIPDTETDPDPGLEHVRPSRPSRGSFPQRRAVPVRRGRRGQSPRYSLRRPSLRRARARRWLARGALARLKPTAFKPLTYSAMHLCVAVTVAYVLTRDWRIALGVGVNRADRADLRLHGARENHLVASAVAQQDAARFKHAQPSCHGNPPARRRGNSRTPPPARPPMSCALRTAHQLAGILLGDGPISASTCPSPSASILRARHEDRLADRIPRPEQTAPRACRSSGRDAPPH